MLSFLAGAAHVRIAIEKDGRVRVESSHFSGYYFKVWLLQLMSTCLQRWTQSLMNAQRFPGHQAQNLISV